MVIKLDFIASAMNRKLTDYGFEIPDERSEWRYYMHLAGQYHHLDEPMLITSIDDSSTIELNIENLKLHKKTRSVYLYDRQYGDKLKVLYPEQTILINGILRPTALSVSTSATDGAILQYDTDLVEKQEYRLISELEYFIRGFLHRYEMRSLLDLDDLYAADCAGKLFAFLTPRILDIRNKYIRTSQTHTFHIMAFLASNQGLDEFEPYLTYSQMLFLYRNILYIEQHTGMSHTFDILVDNLLTVRNLPIYDYTLRQRDMDIDAGELQPYPVFVKNQLNLSNGLDSRDLEEYDIADVLIKEVPLARDNDGVYESTLAETELITGRSSISNIPTKILEVSAVDPENVDPIKIIDVLINEWMDQSCTGMYTGILEILNPLNGDTIKLDPGGMFLLYFYAHSAGFHGSKLTEIPKFIAKNVLRKRWIMPSEYLSIVEYDMFDGWDGEIDFFTDTHPINYVEPLTAEEFQIQALEFVSLQRVRHQYIFQAPRATDRTGRRVMYNYNYIDTLCDFRNDLIGDYKDLFTYIALDNENMSDEAWQDLAMEALNAATNYASMNRISLKEIQSAMVRLFKRLSSYTVQFIEEILGGETISTEPLIAILGDTFERGEGSANTSDNISTIENVRVHSTGNVNAPQRAVTIGKVTTDEKRVLKGDVTVKATVRELPEFMFKSVRPASGVASFTVESL